MRATTSGAKLSQLCPRPLDATCSIPAAVATVQLSPTVALPHPAQHTQGLAP